MKDKNYFILIGSVAAYTKTEFTNQTTSNNGEIYLNMCENRPFYAKIL